MTPDALDRGDLMWGLLRGFRWLDRALQQSRDERGWAPIGGTESQIMFFVATGTSRPSEIARQLGISRQAVHKAVHTLVERKLVVLEDDPNDRRGTVVAFSADGAAERRDTHDIILQLERELEARIGKRAFGACKNALQLDWGEPPHLHGGA